MRWLLHLASYTEQSLDSEQTVTRHRGTRGVAGLTKPNRLIVAVRRYTLHRLVTLHMKVNSYAVYRSANEPHQALSQSESRDIRQAREPANELKRHGDTYVDTEREREIFERSF